MTMRVVVDTKVLEALPQRTDQRVAQFLSAEAEQTVNDIKLSIQQVSLGRMYRRKKKIHIASKPGDPPNVDLGRLINSYKWRRKGEHTRIIETDVEYAPYLEFGSERGLAAGMLGPKQRIMAPRPHVGPALERLRERLPRDAKKFGLVR